MSNARDYLLVVEDDKAGAQTIAHATAQELQNRQTTLIDVVKSLGEYINDGDEKIRSKAISYLTAVLSDLPPNYLTRQQIQVLCQFYCDRIEDGGAIEGLSKLQSLERFTNDMAQIVVRAIFEHFSDLQTRTQSARYRILQLLNELMTDHRKALHNMGEESLIGITDLVSGEKDPRNLMLIFSMLRVMMIEWDITGYTETMFDSVYAYFPITFRPPPNDPYGITAQDLKDRLRDCISSSSVLAPYALPNLLDKLDSTSPVVKKDVLQALLACAQSWDLHTMSQYSITLWDSLKFELLSAQEQELADETLLVLREIAVNLSRSTNSSPTSSPLAQYLRPVTKECLEHLQEPAQRQAKAAGDMLKAVSSASTAAFSLIIRSTLAPLFTVYQSADGIIKQRALLEVMNQLFESAISVFGTWKTPIAEIQPVDDNPLDPFNDKFLAVYGQALMSTVKEEVSFRVTAAKGLLLLSKMRNFLQDNEIGLIVQHYDEIVLREESYGRDELRRTAMQGLAEISANKPGPIMEITFPAFLARLPDTGAEADSSNTYHITLEGLAQISIEREVSETLIRRLLNKIEVLLQVNDDSVRYLSAILSTVYYVLKRGAKTGNLEQHYDRVVVGLTQRVIADLTSGRRSVLCHSGVLELLGRIDNIILRHSPSKQEHASANIYALFTDGLTLDLITHAPEAGGLSTGELRSHGPHSGNLRKAMILSTFMLATLPRNHAFEVDQVQEITTKVCEFIIRESELEAAALSSEPILLASLRQIALYINKHLPNSRLEIANDLLAKCYKSLTLTGKHVWVRLIFIITKALVLRLAPNSDTILADLVSLLHSGTSSGSEETTIQINAHDSPQISKVAAYGFRTLLSDDEIISTTNYAQIRLLAPQRVFHTLTPLISSQFKHSSDPAEKESCLVALSGVISTVPSELVMSEFTTLLPLLLQSLDLQQETVKTATLETLAVVIARNPSALEESGHVPALVKRLLKTATISKTVPRNGRGDESMHSEKLETSKTVPPPPLATDVPTVRRLAVRCLFLMPGYISKGSGSRPNPLLALKRDVLQGLLKVLDDPKRDVRKEAVDARAAWIRGVDDIQEEDSD